MLDALLQLVEKSVTFVLAQLFTVLVYPFLPNQRIFCLYLLTSALFAYYIYRKNTKTPAPGQSMEGFFRFLFPKEVWQTASAWLDVRYFFFHQVVRLIIYGAFLTGTINLVYQLITGGPDVIAASTAAAPLTAGDMAVSVAYMLVFVGFGDFIAFASHYAQHKVPLLWEFHKVHHSLEVMHPLSNYREHPVDNLFYAVCIGAGNGLVMGLATRLLGHVPSLPMVLGLPLLLFAFNILGYNLRHSHVWLRWPGRWAMAFASPAHHHVHHSCHPDHIDKNMAFMFPIWDVLFGTYEMPETNKDVRFGLAPDYVNEYTSCLGLYLIPFRNAWRRFVKGGPPSTQQAGNPGTRVWKCIRLPPS